MFDDDDYVYVCVCGKKKGNINSTNWTRHTTSCKVRQNKIQNTDISSFFKRSAATISTKMSSTQTKKLRPGKYSFNNVNKFYKIKIGLI